MTAKSSRVLWALLATSIPMFMVALDNLVVTNALAEMADDFGARQSTLQWIVNGYLLSFAGLLLGGAALGDRFGRRRVFAGGILLFTVSSAVCAMAESVGMLLAARAVQGIGGAIILPVSLTLAVAAVSEKQRNMAIGVWGGVNGLGIALGPLAGGAVAEYLSWHWIFWINVPVGLLALPMVVYAIAESRGAERNIDGVGVVLVTGSVVSAVWGIVAAADHGWGGPRTVAGIAVAIVLFIIFLRYERHVAEPLVPLRMYRIRDFMLSNAASLAMHFGVFGSVFFLMQFLQGPMGFGPLEAGLSTLPWTAAPVLVVPLASLLIERVGGGALQACGYGLQSVALGWLALTIGPDMSYGVMVVPMALAGIGMGLAFAAIPATVLASVADSEHNKASGVNSTIREFGGALGIAVATPVFTHGFDRSADGSSIGDQATAFSVGTQHALWLGAVIVAVAVPVALLIRRPSGTASGSPDAEVAPARHNPLPAAAD
ncbi:MFS transporter [Nocardia mexicana]|uniref:EmrB/QacA subfamily drug resistance transporter n=1 Tax=Nocardia mexicana TaxID=279262 RepID=A0A370GNE9_9NOCA|nr:MFS transporter [Nocardia mexicana]RDI45248.1 EmrB/QacA subfamily drug resistance transporter [Nocardia mexicana]